jgi:predicted XRE-type DNA-binding protein
MPKKRKFMSMEEAIALVRAQVGPQTPAEEFDDDVALLGHYSRTVWMYAISNGRKTKKLTQQQLAEISGVPQPEISRLEGGLANPTLDTMVKLMVALDLQLALVPAKYKLVTS